MHGHTRRISHYGGRRHYGRRAAGIGVAVAAVTLTLALPAGAARLSTAGLNTAGLSGTALSTHGSGQPAQAGAHAMAVTGSAPVTITLITGDKVTVGHGPGGRIVIRNTQLAPRPAGGPVALETFTDGSHTYVVPTDALRDFANGTLDRQLFDVAYLSSNGYADNKTSQLPVILQYRQRHMSAAALGQASRAIPAVTTTPTALTSVNAAAVRLPKARAASFWRNVAGTTAAPASGSVSAAATQAGPLGHGLAKIWLDAKVTASDDVSDAQIGAPAAWAAGYDGTGVNVGIIDTGIDATHPDLASKVAAAQNFVPAGEPGGGDPADVTDRFGHGTHVASIIAGTGAASAGKYKGVAPGAGLIIAKALNDNGNGADSTIIAAMQWEAATEHAKVVNMSIGGNTSDGTDPLSQAVDNLTAQDGTLFVVAAGNTGPNQGTINAPGAAADALTVAAVDSSDKLAGFSSQGPTLGNALKPDIAAPGVSIIAARAAGTSLGEDDGIPGDGPVDQYYTAASGTSMATPHVAAAAAILAEQHPSWDASQLKDTLMSTATDDGYSVYQQGAGRVDVARAVSQDVDASTPNLDYGQFMASQATPVTKTITYTNFGSQDVTLNLTDTLGTVDGQAAPASTLTLSADSLTVPANGTAQVSATLDPAKAPGGTYTGYVHATDTADGVQLATPVGYAELDQVHFHVTAPAGAYDYTWFLTRVDKPAPIQLFSSDDGLDATQDLAPGTYSVTTFVLWNADDGPQTAMLVNPEFTVAGSTQVDLSTSDAKKISVGIKDTRTQAYSGEFGFNRMPAGYPKACCTGVTSVNWTTDYAELDYWVTPTAPVRTGSFKYTSNWMLGKPVLSASVAGRPGLALRPEYAFTDPSIPKLAGSRTAPLVNIHDGQPGDFQGLDLHGKVALLHVPPGYNLENGTYCAGNSDLDRVTAAANAGAIAVLAYSDTGRPCTFPASDMGASSLHGGHPKFAIPTATVTASAGKALASATRNKPAQLRYEGTPTTPDLYFLTLNNEGQVPSTVTYSLSAARLASVRTRFHASIPSVTQVTAYGHQPDDFQSSLHWYAFLAPTMINEHYGPLSPSVIWDRSAAAFGPAQQWPVATVDNTEGTFDSADVFTRPTSTTEDWGTSPVVPGPDLLPDAALAQGAPGPWLGAPYWALCGDCRQGNFFTPTFFEIGASPTTIGQLAAPDAFFGGANEFHLYSGSQEIQPVYNNIFTVYQLPAGKAQYTLTNHYVWPWPPSGPATQGAVDTSWTFSSAAPTANTVDQAGDACMGTVAAVAGFGDSLGSGPCNATPLIFLSYNLGLNMDNTLTRPGAHTYQVTAYEQPSSAPSPSITKLTLSVSYDNGATWQPARVTPEGNGKFAVTTVQPPRHSAGFASIKAQATDSAGNTVQQVINDAYSLGG